MAGHRQRAERGALVEADVARQERHRVREAGDDHVEQRRADADMDADRVQQEEDAEPAGDPGHDEDQARAQHHALRGRRAGQERADALGQPVADAVVTARDEQEPAGSERAARRAS